jgi:hypothetical protein
VTHGHLPETSNFGGCAFGKCEPLPEKEGPMVSDLFIHGFTYGLSDMGVIGQSGIPRVPVGETLRFWNLDTAANI